MAIEGLTGITFDKMKVMAPDEVANNKLNGLMNDSVFTVRTLDTHIQFDGAHTVTFTPGYMSWNGMVIKWNNAKLVVGNIQSGLGLYLVFDKDIENVSSGDVGTSSYTADLNQIYLYTGMGTPAGVTSYIQVATWRSPTKLEEWSGIVDNRNLHLEVNNNLAEVGNDKGIVKFNPRMLDNLPQARYSNGLVKLIRVGNDVTLVCQGIIGLPTNIPFSGQFSAIDIPMGYLPNNLDTTPYGYGDVDGRDITVRLEKVTGNKQTYKIINRGQGLSNISGQKWIELRFKWTTIDAFPFD